MPLYQRCPRCFQMGLHSHVDYPESGRCLFCGHVEYRGGVRNEQPTVGPDGFQWERVEAKAKRDLAELRTAWDMVW